MKFNLHNSTRTVRVFFMVTFGFPLIVFALIVTCVWIVFYSLYYGAKETWLCFTQQMYELLNYAHEHFTEFYQLALRKN